MKKTAAVLAGIALAVVGVPAAASASEAKPAYVLAYWTITTPGFTEGGDVWGPDGQTLAAFTLTDSTDLTALQGSVPCGAWYQGDLYGNDSITAALLAGGIGVAKLYGPNRPTESPAPGVNPWYIASWYSGDCVEKPTPRPFADSASTSDCEYTTTTTREGFFDLTFDPIGNVWTEAATPTITAEGSSQAPVSVGEKSEACPVAGQLPTLADTGPEEHDVWLFGAMGAALLGAGVALVAGIRYRKRADK